MKDSESSVFPGKTLRVLIADDHPVVRHGLMSLVIQTGTMQVVAEAIDGEDAIQKYEATKPDVALIDLVMPRIDGVEAIRRIRQLDPEAHTIVLTTFSEDNNVVRAMRAGARGYILKDEQPPTLVHAIRSIADGGTYIPAAIAQSLAMRMGEVQLTERELEVTQRVVDGLGNKQIAAAMQVSESTVKTHINSIFSKLGVNSRPECINLALRRGIARI